MIKSAVTARDSVNPVSLRINFSIVTANPPAPTIEVSQCARQCVLMVGMGREGRTFPCTISTSLIRISNMNILF